MKPWRASVLPCFRAVGNVWAPISGCGGDERLSRSGRAGLWGGNSSRWEDQGALEPDLAFRRGIIGREQMEIVFVLRVSCGKPSNLSLPNSHGTDAHAHLGRCVITKDERWMNRSSAAKQISFGPRHRPSKDGRAMSICASDMLDSEKRNDNRIWRFCILWADPSSIAVDIVAVLKVAWIARWSVCHSLAWAAYFWSCSTGRVLAGTAAPLGEVVTLWGNAKRSDRLQDSSTSTLYTLSD